MSVHGARDVAATVLARVAEDGAFAAAVLDTELRRHGLDPRDAGLATELAYGVLRTEGWLEDRLAERATKGRGPGQPLVRAHVLIGLYTLAFLDRVPRFAAVSEAVEGARRAGGEGASRFVNAVLRAFADEIERGTAKLAVEDAIAASAPGWLRGALRRSIGRQGAVRYLAAGPVPPPVGLALGRAEDRGHWLERLRESAERAEIALGRVSPRALNLRGGGDLRRLPGFEEAFIVQEEGAQVVGLLLGARAGDAVLDACAGRGNKAWLLGDEIGSTGRLALADKYPDKLRAFTARPHAPPATTHAVDWLVGSGDVGSGFDRVLVDAPCSGTGTLRRRPEIARHRTPEGVTELSHLQVAITRRAATCAKDGARLVYAVCSVLAEEAEAVVEQLVAGEMGGVRLEPAPFDAPVVAELAAGRTSLRLLPHEHGTDGYFAASFVVRRR